MVYTACRIVFKRKENVYVLSVDHKNGEWEGSSMGKRIYPVDEYLVETSWGSGKPSKVYKNEQEMLDSLTTFYNCKVVLTK